MRMWEIRENAGRYDSDYRMGMKQSKLQEAYDCGFEDGYKKAMSELEDSHRGDESDMGERGYRRRK